MRVFVTGASGFIGRAVVPELLGAGHQVVGLARSDTAAAAVSEAGAEVVRGELADLDVLRSAAADADAVVHLGFVHDFSRMAEAAATDRAAIEALGDGLVARRGTLAIASGVAGLGPGVVTETDDADPDRHPRVASAHVALALADRGVRPVVVRLAPTVHGEGDHGFVAALAGIAVQQGVAGYVGEGTNHWSAVHRSDAARLFRLAVEQPTAGPTLHAIAEEGVELRAIAAALGRTLGLPVRSIPGDEAADHFGWLATFLAFDVLASSAITREQLGWEPTGPTLLDDIEAGHYPGH